MSILERRQLVPARFLRVLTVEEAEAHAARLPEYRWRHYWLVRRPVTGQLWED